MSQHHFNPGIRGWVVRWTTIVTPSKQRPVAHEYTAWWYGPSHGWGTTSGPLDYSVAVWDTKREATAAARQLGRRSGLTIEKVADAVAFAITECDRRKADVLAGNHPDKRSIAKANDKSKAYLEGR